MHLLTRAARLLPRYLAQYRRDLTSRFPAAVLDDADSKLVVTLDMVLSHYRRTHPGVCFLQIGAFDGMTGDPLFPLIASHNLSGYLVEPQPEAFSQLKTNYARFQASDFTFIQAAIGENDGTVPLYRVRPGAGGPEWMPQTASLDAKFLAKLSDLIPGVESMIEVERVQCLTFETLFSRFGIGHIDLLQIDAEGYDGKLLQMFDVRVRSPAIVQFEHKHLGEPAHKSCLDLLVECGYKIALSRDDTLAYRARPDAGLAAW